MLLKKAIIFDRDGTLIKDRGYIRNISDVEFYNIDLDLMRLLNKKFLFFIVSNQGGIGTGIVSAAEVEKINSHIKSYFSKSGIRFKRIYYCPHTDIDNCRCKKPRTYFLDLVKSEYSIDPSASYVIGDHPSDMLFAANGGLKGIYLLTGHGRKHLGSIERDKYPCVKRNLNNALKYIIESEG